MTVIRDMAMPEACTLTLGKFESLHRGHQYLMEETIRLAKQRGLPSAVMAFEPHPRRVLSDPSYKPMFTPAERRYILRGTEIDYWVECPFDHAFANRSAEDFCTLLFGSLHARVLVVGECFRFGKERAGSVEMLIQTGRRYDAEVSVLAHRSENGQKIGTSAIRELILAHDMRKTAKGLGFSFFVMGEVRHGDRIGREMGFPTVNILPGADKLLPPDGVYVTRTRLGERLIDSITNVGVRPTIKDSRNERRVESFLLNFDGEVYGQEIITEFIDYIRPERQFENIGALKSQIAEDIRHALQGRVPSSQPFSRQ